MPREEEKHRCACGNKNIPPSIYCRQCIDRKMADSDKYKKEYKREYICVFYDDEENEV